MQTATLSGIQATKSCGVTLANIGAYVVPGATSAVVSHIAVCNTSAVAITCNLTLYNGSTDIYLAFGAPIGIGDTLTLGSISVGPIVLASGWSVRCSVSVAGNADASMSVTQAT